MNNALIFASLVAAIWAAGMALRVEVPRVVFAFLLAQTLFTLAAWLADQHWTNVGQYYTLVYGIAFIAPAILAIGFSVQALSARMWPLIVAEIATLSGMLYVVRLLWGDGPWPYRLMGTVAAVYAVSGFFVILSLAVLSSPAWDMARLIVGLFLLSQGVLHLLFVAGAGIQKAEMMAVSNWCPALVAIGLFLWLGHSLATASH